MDRAHKRCLSLLVNGDIDAMLRIIDEIPVLSVVAVHSEYKRRIVLIYQTGCGMYHRSK